MEYTIEKLNRTVELDDRIVEEYRKYRIVRDNPFFIAVMSQFGHAPTEEEFSSEELSKMCNIIMLDELKVIGMLPRILEDLPLFVEASKKGCLLEVSL